MTTIDGYRSAAALERRFRAAARHTRLVRTLRVVVPGAVILSLAAIVLLSVYNPFRTFAQLPVDIGNLVVSGTKITMESPHLSGYSPDQRPYEMWAKTAVQDLTKPNQVELNVIHATMAMEDKSTVILDSKTGLYNSKDQTLDLRKDIFLQSSTGYEARLTQAFVDMSKGTVTSDEPVDVKLLNGTLRSDRLNIAGGGEIVRFEGNVRMDLQMDSPPPPAAEPPPAAPPQPSEPAAPSKKPKSGKRANAKQ